MNNKNIIIIYKNNFKKINNKLMNNQIIKIKYKIKINLQIEK